MSVKELIHITQKLILCVEIYTFRVSVSNEVEDELDTVYVLY